jgi:tetratricopeptide (TPR) repeat protein
MPLCKSAIIPKLLLLSFFLTFFLLFTGPVIDGDCFWHLATGRWIAEHGKLPGSDPLSFTVTDHNQFRPESGRVSFLLKQYWLGQLALFGTWQAAGSAGMVLLRAITYTCILAFLYLWMLRHRKGLFPLLLTALAGLLLREIPNERPQLFTFVFMPLVLFLLERGAIRDRLRNPALLLLPLVTVIWANTHGAYILGVVLIALNLACCVITSFLRRQTPDYPYMVVSVVAMAVTLLNPSGAMAWREFFQTLPVYAASVYENLSPFYVAIRLHDWHPAYWAYLLICMTTIATAWRRMALVHLVMLTMLSLLSLTGLRYLIFPLLAAPLLVRYLPEIGWDLRKLLAVTAALAVWVGCSWDRDILSFGTAPRFPAKAADFIRQESPAPQIFNYYDWGGYLAWSIPGMKTFIDGRGLVEEISLLEDRTMNGIEWRQTMDRYGINTVVVPGMSETPGSVYPLAEALAEAADWQLVFSDDTALVFVRELEANRKVIAGHLLDRRLLQAHLVKSAERLISRSPDREEYWQTKANALQLLGDRQGAITAYRRVLQLNPRNDWARRMIAAGGN